MGRVPLFGYGQKLAPVALLSSLVLLIVILALPARAHEIRPAIADIEVGTGTVRLEIELSLEPLVAGMNLQGLDDTDAAPEADRYDRLRALDPDALAAEFDAAWPEIRAGLRLRSGAAPVEPRVAGVEIPEVGDLSLPRDSRVVLTATLPEGRAPVIFGWAPEYGPIVLRQAGNDAEEGYTGYLTDGQDSAPIPRDAVAEDTALAAFGRYILIGFDHIVPKGLDHILFVLGLFFFSLKARPLLYQVSAFTVAHTVTLALAALGIVTVSKDIVEPLIALSIAYVAVENIVFRELKPWRTAVVFGFGLLHGIGFASILGEIGLSPGRFLAGLIGFNIGVEFGQLAVLLGAYGMFGIWFGDKPWYRARIAIPASLLIAAVGSFWFIERLGLLG